MPEGFEQLPRDSDYPDVSQAIELMLFTNDNPYVIPEKSERYVKSNANTGNILTVLHELHKVIEPDSDVLGRHGLALSQIYFKNGVTIGLAASGKLYDKNDLSVMEKLFESAKWLYMETASILSRAEPDSSQQAEALVMRIGWCGLEEFSASGEAIEILVDRLCGRPELVAPFKAGLGVALHTSLQGYRGQEMSSLEQLADQVATGQYDLDQAYADFFEKPVE